MSKGERYREQGLTTNWLMIHFNVPQSRPAMIHEERRNSTQTPMVILHVVDVGGTKLRSWKKSMDPSLTHQLCLSCRPNPRLAVLLIIRRFRKGKRSKTKILHTPLSYASPLTYKKDNIGLFPEGFCSISVS